MNDLENANENSQEQAVFKSRNVDDSKKTLTFNSKSGTQGSNLDFPMKCEPKYENAQVNSSNASLSHSRITDMHYGVSRQMQKKNPPRSKETLVRRIIFRNNNKDLTDSQIIENPNEETTNGFSENNRTSNVDRRDSSTIRLRQMIALKQQSNKAFDQKDERMMQKLKPYLNKFKITNGDGNLKNIKKISFAELEKYKDSKEIGLSNNNNDIIDVHNPNIIRTNGEEHTPLKERPQIRKSHDDPIIPVKSSESILHNNNFNKSNQRINTTLNKNRESIGPKIKRISNAESEQKNCEESEIVSQNPRIK